MLGAPPQLFGGGKVYMGYGSPRNARIYTIDTIRGNLPKFVPPRTNRALLFDGWEALCKEFAAPVFFEKSPQLLGNWAALSLLLEWKKQTKFNLRIVGLVRNPLAVQHSAEVLFGTPPESRQYAWAETYRNLLALRQMLPPEELIILRYEDIVADPVHIFSGVCKFIGLVPDPSMGSSVRREAQDRWREDDAYDLQLAPAVLQIASALGYSEVELANSTSVSRRSRSFPGSSRILQRFGSRLRDRQIKPMLMRHRLPPEFR